MARLPAASLLITALENKFAPPNPLIPNGFPASAPFLVSVFALSRCYKVFEAPTAFSFRAAHASKRLVGRSQIPATFIPAD